MEKEGSKAASASSAVSAALGLLHAEKAEVEASATASEAEQVHAEKAEAEASATASEAEQVVKEPEAEDLKQGVAQGLVAVADLGKAEAEAAVGEEGDAGAAAPVLADIVNQKAEAEEGVAVRGPPDAGKGKEEVVVREAEVEDPYTAWVASGKKRKFEELGEPVYPSDSDGSLEYDSTESVESVDKRNVGSFKHKLLEQLRGGSLRYLNRGRYTCPWHTRKPKCATKNGLKQHAAELSRTGTSPRIRAQHQVLLVVLEE